VGGPGQRPDSLALRGSESTSYNFLTNTSISIGIDNKDANHSH
jgi:hypothetical protein